MERIVSPGVFTQETDKSFLPQGIGEIGAAVIGPTTKGPAYIPTQVTSYSDYELKFGVSDAKSYVPYLLREYLRHAGTALVVRILGIGGYTHVDVASIILSGSIGEKVVAILHHTTGELDSDLADTTIGTNSGSTNFDLTISGSTIVIGSTYTALSLNSTDANYIGKIFSDNPNSLTLDAYNYVLFKNYCNSEVSESDGFVSLVTTDDLVLTTDYQAGTTPWVQSQEVAGNVYNLFRLKTVSHGNYTNSEIKVGITNIKFASEIIGSDYGNFGIVVRKRSDNDRAPVIIESYNNLTLDPDSPNYIAKRIGDKVGTYNTTEEKIFWAGDYDNRSDYIIVEVDDNVKDKSYSGELVPHGFAPIQQPMAVTSYTMPTASMVTRQMYNDLYNSKIYFGFDFDFDNNDNANYLMPIAESSTTGSNEAFNLSTDADFSDQPDAPTSASDASVKTRKFIIPFQGGFDGRNPASPKYMGTSITATNTMGYDCSTTTSSGSVGYQRSLTLLEDQDQYDIKLLFTPGIIRDLHPNVITKGIDVCESRGDCFYVFDSVATDTVNLDSVVSSIEDVDSSYAATYYPWIKILDTDFNRNMWVPASVGIAGAYAYNDKVGYEWWAPAGLNRGGLSVIDVYYPLSQPNRDTLYDGRVNPIASFPNEGIVVWGQKTLQSAASALDRINVRRLLINVKKFIASSTKWIIFDQNTTATRNKFLNIVNPYMETIQQRAGLYSFEVRMDETTNPPEIVDRNEMRGEIWLQPTKTAEMILINFSIMGTGAVFGS